MAIDEAGQQRRYDLTVDGQAAGTGTLRKRRNPSNDDLIYELAVRGRPPIPLTVDDHTALTRPRRSRGPQCAGCGGPLDKHGLDGLDLGEKYCFDCT
ncbi:hypothetical protein GCM10017673_56170 [Streptosporangium violaceochromogenes]|nr:hypothetical protein GCM10017673_56170 [Streptosporangium violaceochromogenes]